jgi:hypothetical protein
VTAELMRLEPGSALLEAYMAAMTHPAARVHRCGVRGCGRVLASEYDSANGVLVVVTAPLGQRNGDQLAEVRRRHGRVAFPEGVVLKAGWLSQFTGGLKASAWCPKHQHVTLCIQRHH